VRRALESLVVGTLGMAMPERLVGDLKGASNITSRSGPPPRTSGGFPVRRVPAGGTGGTARSDGNNCMRNFAEGDISSIQPIEALETSCPLRVERMTLRQDSGGPGRHRGGLGLQREIRVLARLGAALRALRQERDSAVWRARRRTGAPNRFTVVRDGSEIEPPRLPGKVTGFDCAPATVVVERTAGGGGYGDPRNATPARSRATSASATSRRIARRRRTARLRPHACIQLRVLPSDAAVHTDGRLIVRIARISARAPRRVDGDLVEVVACRRTLAACVGGDRRRAGERCAVAPRPHPFSDCSRRARRLATSAARRDECRIIAGVDVGGTFTDVVLFDAARSVARHQGAVDPDNQSEGVRNGLQALLPDLGGLDKLVHGTTVSTNTMLQGTARVLRWSRRAAFATCSRSAARGACCRASTTRLPSTAAAGSAAAALRGQRALAADGSVLTRSTSRARRHRAAIRDARAEAVAICFLHAYVNAAHERARRTCCTRCCRGLDHDVGGSRARISRVRALLHHRHQCLPAAGDGPLHLVAAHEARRGGLSRQVFTMSSGGGIMDLDAARRMPVRTILSGPRAASPARCGSPAPRGSPTSSPATWAARAPMCA
jgi:hypothetical protein